MHMCVRGYGVYLSKIIRLDIVDFWYFNIINDFFLPNAEIIHPIWQEHILNNADRSVILRLNEYAGLHLR